MKKKRVLVIDDEPDILEFISEVLRYSGFNVKEARCGNEAIDVLKLEKFDFVISDYRMPNGNGMAILNHVTNMTNPPVFIFVSGQADVSVKECLDAGALKFFSKPFDLDELVYFLFHLSLPTENEENK
jgi:DNA-binding NtrC family response regulator